MILKIYVLVDIIPNGELKYQKKKKEQYMYGLKHYYHIYPRFFML